MRRFLIWSVLAALVGLVLAGTGYWAYWNFYSRFQPVTITRNQAQIQPVSYTHLTLPTICSV